MKVSVIIPNYRHADYLTERIESVLNQTYPDFEVILLDDSSPDDSCEVLERYRCHPKVSHLVLNQENSGSTFRQWERGFALARGEYIWIAESDDYADPEFLSNCMARFEEHPDSVIVYTESQIVDSRSHALENRFGRARGSMAGCRIWSGKEFVLGNMLLHNSIYNASMAVFRKSALPALSTHTRYRLNGDWLFWCKIALQGDVAHINRPLNYFRQHEEKVTVEQRRNGEGLIELTRLYEELFGLMRLPRLTRWAIEGRIGKHMRLASRRLPEERRSEIREQWRDAHRAVGWKSCWYLFYNLLHLRPRIR